MNPEAPPAEAVDVERRLARIERREAVIGVIGLGYVGLPLCLAAASAGFRVVGFDVDAAKPRAIQDGRTYLEHIPARTVAAAVGTGRLLATTDFDRLSNVDAVLVCVPTPLTRQREPDLSFVENTTREIAKRLKPGQLIVLESTTWPGTTDEIVRPLLERPTGLRSGRDFFLAFSPEREDPGNQAFETRTMPKVVGGDGPDALRLAAALYGSFVDSIVPVSSMSTAEAVKITENIFRAVNIALVNELKVIYDAMGISVWEVIEAAKTKPFGFMPFYPGPGLGGHCIPIDPFYLTWKAREFGISTRFVELAGEINRSMPHYVVGKLALALDAVSRRGLNGSRILLVGLAYKKNISDVRESPAFMLLDLIEGRGGQVDYLDPFVPEVPPTREHPQVTGRRSVAWSPEAIASYDAVVIVTDHDSIDYGTLVARAPIVIDTRHACASRGLSGPNVVEA